VIRERPNDLFGAIELAISKGGDTDTIAAMAGAIVGAGRDSIDVPDNLMRWIGWPSASQIADLNEVNYAQIVQANVVVLPAVLYHGFRRLFPPYYV